jgi:UDP-N-acetylglucosamine acyltransferase
MAGMSTIHPTALIDASAQLDADVDVGPYCVIGPHVRVGAGTRLHAHVVLTGHTSIGANCEIFPFACIGGQTQDLKFKGGTSYVEVGDRTTLREYVTVNAGTDEGGITKIGRQCHIMAYAHIAHDCIVGHEVIIANCGTLAGHVVVEDQVILGGLSAVHQFTRLGRLCIIGGCNKVVQDVPPFMMADGNPLQVHTINSIGLKRKEISAETQSEIKRAFKILYRDGLSTSQAVAKLESELQPLPEIQQLIAFVKSSERGITK